MPVTGDSIPRNNKPKRTDKQRQIMHLILEAFEANRFYTVSELHAALPYTCAYGSLRGSLKFLERKGIIEMERTGMSKVIKPTLAAFDWFRTAGRV